MKRILALHFVLGLLTAPLPAYDVATHRAVALVACRDHPESKVATTLIRSLGYPAGLLAPASIGPENLTFLDWLVAGAEHEDSDLVFRYARHFYDPITKTGLADGSVLGLPIPGTRADALSWAWDNEGAALNANHGWKHARASYLEAVLAWGGVGDDTDTYRRTKLAETFYDLGHCVHLLQDMAQPQHTRNDAHMPEFLRGDGAPYEAYCARNYGTAPQLLSLPHVPVPRFGPAHFAYEAFTGDIPPEFASLWDTHQLSRWNGDGFLVSDPSSLDPNSLGLAEFSNAYFVTDDTLFTGEPATLIFLDGTTRRLYSIDFDPSVETEHRFRFPRFLQLEGLARLNIPDFAVISAERVGENGPSFPLLTSAGVPLSLRGSGLGAVCLAHYDAARKRLLLGLDDVTREAQAKALLPRAIAYSTGLLNYFFRGTLRVNYLPQGSGRGIVEVVNESEEPLDTGKFWVLERPTFGSLLYRIDLLREVPSAELYTAPTPNGGVLRIPVTGVTQGRDIRVVFKGTLGSEREIAVATGRHCAVPPADPTHRFHAVDLGAVAGIFANDVANWGMNNQDQLMGFHQPLSNPLAPTGGGGFVWSDANEDDALTADERRFVGTAGGGPGARIMDLNDLGVVTGTVLRNNGIFMARWRPEPDGHYPSDPEIGDTGLGGLTINNLNTVLDPLRGALWPEGGPSFLLADRFKQQFGATIYRLDGTLDLNDAGRLLVRVTSLNVSAGQTGTFMLWQPGGALIDTGIQAGPAGVLNNTGQAALLTFKKRTVNGLELNLPNLVVWDESTGGTVDLDTSMSLFDLNDCGQLVGHTTSAATSVPMIWSRDAGLRGLNVLANLPPGVTLTHVLKLDCNGRILAAGNVAGQIHVFLLTPP